MSLDPDLIGVVLAGGLSRRMGEQEKSLLELGGKPIISHVIERLKSQTSNILINANGDPARFSRFGLPVQADTVEGFAGPLAGILAGMRWCETNAQNCKYVLSVASDTPFFPNSLAEKLLAEIPKDQDAIALASSDNRRHPVFGLWSISLADDLHKFLADEENRKVMLFVERYPNCIVDFEFETSDPFFNVNTPEDLVVAQGHFS